MNSTDDLKKAAFESQYNIPTDTNLEPAPSRMQLGAFSTFSLSSLNGTIYEEVKKELRWPESTKLYKQMLLDSSVDTPYRLIELLITRPNCRIAVPENSTEVEKQRCKMLNHNILNMYRHFSDYLSEAISFIVYGHWEGEKIFKKINSPHGTYIGINDIRTISQDTVEKWIFNYDTGQVVGLRQNLSNIITDSKKIGTRSYVDIPRKKFIQIRNGVKRDNPEGSSVLKSCYINWKYKALLEEFQSIGVIKDLSGIPIFEVDTNYIAKANADPAGPEARNLAQMQQMGQSLHAGDLSCGIIPTAYDERGNKLFNFKLQGIEGGGKQYDPLEIIKYHSNCILISFFADVLSLGSSGSGSFALSDNKMSLLSLAIESWTRSIKRAFDREFIQHIYQMNQWDYDPEISCQFEFDDLDDGSIDVVAGAIQKVMAVGAIRPTEDIENTLRDLLLDLPPTNDSTVFLDTENKSGAGRGMKTGLGNGVGDSTSTGLNRSVANVSKNTI